MDAANRRRRTALLLWSWSLQTGVILGLYVFIWCLADRAAPASLLTPACLKFGLLVFSASSAWWMLFGWIKVAEGPFLYAEYGGVENRLRCIRFRDRPDWELREPLPIRLEFNVRPGALVMVSVWENFMGRNRIMYSALDLYTGENVYPDDPDL